MPWALLVYCATSLLHFAHNAEYLADYPNLPAWITRGSVYVSWCGIFMLGLCGYLLYRRSHEVAGLSLLTIYTALGLDGLLHYGRAPLSSHSIGMNVTILAEAVAAGFALALVIGLAASRLRAARTAT